jgi:hypothetical protein
MEEEVWSQSEATPVVQQFPSKSLHNAPPSEWQAMHPGKLNNASIVATQY